MIINVSGLPSKPCLCKTCRRLDFKSLALTYSWIMDIRYQNKSWNHIEEKTVKHKEPEGSIGVHMLTAGVRAGAGEEQWQWEMHTFKVENTCMHHSALYYTYNITLRACSIQHLLLSSLCCRGVASWWKQKFYEILPTNSCRADHLAAGAWCSATCRFLGSSRAFQGWRRWGLQRASQVKGFGHL